MEQLIMRWKNDGKPAELGKMPAGCEIVNYLQLENAMMPGWILCSTDCPRVRWTPRIITAL